MKLKKEFYKNLMVVKMLDNDFKNAFDRVMKELMKDECYRNSWQSIIAVKFQDVFKREGYQFPDLDKLSNYAAKEFIESMIKLSSAAKDGIEKQKHERESIEPVLIQVMTQIKPSTANLCDYCRHDIAICKSEKVEYGNGVGEDNVIECTAFKFLGKKDKRCSGDCKCDNDDNI